MNVVPLESPVEFGRRPLLIGLTFKRPVLGLLFDPDAGGVLLRITFEHCRAFRCLDEGDLLRYWEEPSMAGRYLVQILDGGWLSDESANHLNVTLAMGPFDEYLLSDDHNCVTVLGGPPKFELVPSQAV